MSLNVSDNITLPDEEIILTAIRAQGAGGQHVNKSSTAIHLRFDIKTSSLTEAHKQRLMAFSHHLITRDGVVIIKSQEHRSQELNRDAALARLVALILQALVVPKVRRLTKPKKSAKLKRLANKAHSGEVKVLRGKVRLE